MIEECAGWTCFFSGKHASAFKFLYNFGFAWHHAHAPYSCWIWLTGLKFLEQFWGCSLTSLQNVSFKFFNISQICWDIQKRCSSFAEPPQPNLEDVCNFFSLGLKTLLTARMFVVTRVLSTIYNVLFINSQIYYRYYYTPSASHVQVNLLQLFRWDWTTKSLFYASMDLISLVVGLIFSLKEHAWRRQCYVLTFFPIFNNKMQSKPSDKLPTHKEHLVNRLSVPTTFQLSIFWDRFADKCRDKAAGSVAASLNGSASNGAED